MTSALWTERARMRATRKGTATMPIASSRSPLQTDNHRSSSRSSTYVRVAMLLVPLGGCAHVVPDPSGAVIQCRVTRDECTKESLSSSGEFGCDNFESTHAAGTACADGNETPEAACNRVFCTPDSFAAPYGFPHCQVDTATQTTILNRGVCTPDTRSSKGATVNYATTARICTPDSSGVACSSLKATPLLISTRCVDLSSSPATTVLLPPNDQRYRTVSINTVQLNACTVTTQSKLTYAMPAGPMGTASGGGAQANVSAVNGLVTFNQSCDPDGCIITSLDDLRVNVANLTVLGVPVTNVVVRSTLPASLTTVSDGESQVTGIAAGDLKLLLDGQVAGQRAQFLAANSGPITVGADAHTLALNGAFDLVSADVTGNRTPVTFSLSAQGRPATPAEQACSNESPTDRIFGFESAASWSSTQGGTLSEVTSPVTQGCGALSVSGQGYIILASAPFSTTQVTAAPSLSFDLFIPDHQPNQFWVGAAQLFLSCPSGNVFNQYIGQVELTGKPQNTYSTLRFPLPAATTSTLARALDDCSIGLTLNVNATGQPWFLDNLRFTP